MSTTKKTVHKPKESNPRKLTSFEVLVHILGNPYNCRSVPKSENYINIITKILDKHPNLITQKVPIVGRSNQYTTFLHLAAQNCSSDIIDLLINRLSRLDNSIEYFNKQEDRYGNTPLHSAIAHGNIYACKVLINYSDLNITDNANMTAEESINDADEAIKFKLRELFAQFKKEQAELATHFKRAYISNSPDVSISSSSSASELSESSASSKGSISSRRSRRSTSSKGSRKSKGGRTQKRKRSKK